MKMNNHKKFDICITTETSNFLELMKTKNVYVYMIIQDEEVLCCYFFRKSCTFIKKDVECITCFASINGPQSKETSIFNIGYLRALWAICDKNPLFQFAVIEDISDNNIIIDFLDAPYLTSPTAYFFYNFAYHTFHKQKVFIIC